MISVAHSFNENRNYAHLHTEKKQADEWDGFAVPEKLAVRDAAGAGFIDEF